MNEMKNLKKKIWITENYKITSDEYKAIYSKFIAKNRHVKEKIAKYKHRETRYKTAKEKTFSYSFSKLFRNEMEELINESGCYLIYNKYDEIIYVGQSSSLGSRVYESIDVTPYSHYVKIVKCSPPDRFILETIYINKFKPLHNKASVGDGKMSFRIPKRFHTENIEKLTIETENLGVTL